MLFKNYILMTLVHVAGVYLYLELGSLELLFPSFIILSWHFMIFVIGVGVLMSPETTIELDEKEYSYQSDYSARLALQAAAALVAYVLYTNGFVIIAGALWLQAIITAVSCLISIYIKSGAKNT